MVKNVKAPAVVAQVSHEVRDIGPAEAERLLGKARNQGGLERRLVEAYKRDMDVGAWKLNGDPVIIDKSGNLLDGRLRLRACIDSGKPFRTLIIKGISPEDFVTIDAVRRRTAGDVMHIRGEEDGRALAAAVRLVWRAAAGDLEKQSKQMSAHELIDILDKNPTIRRSLTKAKIATPTLAHGLATALHFLFQNEHRQAADQFFVEFAAGLEAPEGAPRALFRALENIRSEGGRRSQKQQIGLAFKAWRSYRSTNDAKLLRFNPESETFPDTPGLDGLELPDAFGSGINRRTTSSVAKLNDAIADTITVEVLDITPDFANELLASNDNNRKIAVGVVQKYTRDIQNGDWALNGQTIKIGRTGRLLDGQHRLSAGVKAQRSFPAIVVRGLDEEVFDTFDVGNRRSFSAILEDMGESNTALLAGALRQVWALENNVVTSRATAPSNNELLDTLEKHPEIRKCVTQGNRFRLVGSPSQLTALHYLFTLADADRAQRFAKKLVDGVGFEEGDPVLALRDTYLRDVDNKKLKISVPERMALAIKAWNASWEGRKLKNLKWVSVGERSEPFPSIMGFHTEQLEAANDHAA